MLWRGVEYANSALMRLRFPTLPAITDETVARINDDAARCGLTLRWSQVSTDKDAQELSAFLTAIPAKRTEWFNPHPFDESTIRRMARSRSFVMLKVSDRERIIGYHFLRCFFVGKAFHGLIVSDEASGKGIGAHMWAIGADIAHSAGLRMEATISESNIPSLRSCRHGCCVTVLSHLPGGYLHLRCEKKDQSSR